LPMAGTMKCAAVCTAHVSEVSEDPISSFFMVEE
jgi:hypothetical protein